MSALIERLLASRYDKDGFPRMDRERGAAVIDCEAAAATIARLEAELAAERKDAERYRWLRDHKPSYFIEFRVEKMIPRGPSSPYWETVSKTRTDSTIDAAMKKST